MTRVEAVAEQLSPILPGPEPSTSDSATSRAVAIVLLLWSLAVASVGHAGLLVDAKIPVIGGYIAGTTTLLCVLGLTIPALKAWLCRLPLRLLVMMNVLRLVGVAFLVSAAVPGGLPGRFARSAGYGDIFAAVAALVLAVGFLPAVTPFRRRLLLAWNVLGMADLLGAVGTTISVLLPGGTAMAPLGTAPMAYVPYFFVPLLVFVHLVIFYRLATGMLASEGMPDQALRQTARS